MNVEGEALELLPKKKRRGGQPGNLNALKHGIYARFIAVRDNEEMADMPDKGHSDELAMARVRLVNAMDEYNKAKENGDQANMVTWDNSIRRHLDTITTIKTHMQMERESEDCLWTTIMEALRATNDREQVK